MKTSRQLNDLIKNLSKQTGINAQVLQKRYFIERFLERISLSEHKQKFIIKGGVLISALVGIAARSTMDIDITVKRMPLHLEAVEYAVKKIIAVKMDDNVEFVYKGAENIRDESDYECFRVSLDVIFDKVRDNIKLDITKGDAITPKEIEFGIEAMLDKRKIELFSYNLETVLSEKIETILSRSVLNTRMRDFYDCYIIDKMYRNKIDVKTFYAALLETANKRGTGHIFDNTGVLIAEIKASLDLKKLWDNYSKSYPYAKGIEFEETIIAIEDLFSANNSKIYLEKLRKAKKLLSMGRELDVKLLDEILAELEDKK